MSGPADSRDNDGSLSPSRRFFRPKLRQATLILPRTGERVKRAFTLREPSLDEETHDSVPLLHSRRPSARREDAFTGVRNWAREAYGLFHGFATSKTGIGIFKCSLAYLVGSLATFVPPIAAILGKNDGKHMVATITVYFHPARSAGSMVEATMLALIAFAYAAFISFTSMGVSALFGSKEMLALGYAIVVIVFCGGGLGFVGWIKQRLGDPLVNVACSLTSLAIITVLTKEGAVQAATFSHEKIVQVLKMVIMGIAATTIVSLIVKPISARRDYREDLKKTTDSLGDMLAKITRSFLTGSEADIKHRSYVTASETYKSAFGSLTRNLNEAKFEHYILGTEEQFKIEAKLVRCLERLAQNLGGLRSAAATQFELTEQSSGRGRAMSRTASSRSAGFRNDIVWSPDTFSDGEGETILASIDEAPEEESDEGDMPNGQTGQSSTGSITINPNSPVDVFSMFILHLGPPLKSLAYTSRQIMEDLPVGPAPKYPIVVDSHFRSSLVDAVQLFERAREEALKYIYSNKAVTNPGSIQAAADIEEVAASCGYFSSSLLDFAEEVLVYLDILEELKLNLYERPRKRSWNWLVFWRNKSSMKGYESESNIRGLGDETAERGLSRPTPRPVLVKPDQGSTSGKPSEKRFSYRLWLATRLLRRDDFRFAIKVGLGASLYAMWSFIPATRPIYSHWRGEWGLLSYMLVCSMTIGGSNTTGYQRFIGTCLGACCAIVAWIASNDNPFALAFLGWLVSVGCFYVIIGMGKGPMGRFILLTYNLSALYAYSLSVRDEEDDDDEGGISPEIWEIVLHRVVAVLIGCVWGIIITRVVWPISARRKLKDGIAILWLRMGLIWKRDPLATLVESELRSTYMGLEESIQLQRFLSHLETLRKASASEFELKGPFPDKIYDQILQLTGRMIDSFHAMNVIMVKDLKASPGEAELLRYTAQERTQMSWRISHLFSVLASSMKLEYPLNDGMPNVEHTRDRLLVKIFEFKQKAEKKDLATDQDYELLYAYALVTGQLSKDISAVGQQVEALYGVLDESSLYPKLDIF